MSVIISSVITEKSMDMASKGKFTFKVVKTATKPEIKRAVEEKFKVNVVSVATLIVKGKEKRTGSKRLVNRTSSWKKAIAALKTGQTISIFDVGGQK
ncbi:50S ribosomal protein L23 [Patescibacteria group bacterium]|nr:50S ribosomal protein L23 [Patescibacteria group bacterium]